MYSVWSALVSLAQEEPALTHFVQLIDVRDSPQNPSATSQQHVKIEDTTPRKTIDATHLRETPPPQSQFVTRDVVSLACWLL